MNTGNILVKNIAVIIVLTKYVTHSSVIVVNDNDT